MAIDPELTRMQVVIDARFDRFEEKLNKAVRASHAAASKIEKDFNKANFGKGMQSQLDGIARSSMLGSTALSALGPAGLAASAGIVAAGLALKGMQASLKFADDLAAMATKLGPDSPIWRGVVIPPPPQSPWPPGRRPRWRPTCRFTRPAGLDVRRSCRRLLAALRRVRRPAARSPWPAVTVPAGEPGSGSRKRLAAGG